MDIMPSIRVILPSMAEMEGKAATTSEAGRLKPRNSWVILIDLLVMAKRGIISMKITIEAPTRLPTKISGSSLIRELIPTEISPMEVKRPKRTKETIKEEIFNFLEIVSTDLTVRPEPIQTPRKESK